MQAVSLFGLLVVVLLSGVSRAAIRASTKTASGYCLKNVDTNTLTLRFSLKLGTDPDGSVLDLQPPTSTARGKIWSENPGICVAPYTGGTVKVYTIESTLDLSAAASHVNPCGVQQDTVLGTYTWYILHRVLEDGFTEGFVDYDRIYKVVCDPLTIVDNVVEATISVTTPNLEKTLDTSAITARLYVERKDDLTNVYSAATDAAVGETLRLALEMDIADPYTSRLNPYGIYGYTTVIGSSTDFVENDLLINSDGCANSLVASRPPFSTTMGWRWFSANNPTNSGKWKLVSGDFPAYKYGTATRMYFRTSWRPCFDPKPTVDMCVNPCLANTGVTESARKKRQTEAEPKQIVTVINIVDHRGQAAGHDDGDSANIVIVVCVLIGLLAVILCASLIVAFTVKSRRAEGQRANNNKRPPHYFTNPPPVYSEKEGDKY